MTTSAGARLMALVKEQAVDELLWASNLDLPVNERHLQRELLRLHIAILRCSNAYARTALAGAGDATAGEWTEWTGRSFHLRRRLTTAEAVPIGPAVDVRGTPEQWRRYEAVRRLLPPGFTEPL